MNDQDRQIWSRMLAHLRATQPTICRQWFEEIEPLGLNSGTLRLRAHSNVHRDYLERVCTEPFSEAGRDVTGHFLTVKFLGPEDEFGADTAAPPATNGAAARREPAPKATAESRARAEALVIDPDAVFENFVVGPGNELAHAAALAVAAKPGHTYNPFFVHGNVGLGKTHLLQAICLSIMRANPGARLYYTSCDGFMTQFMEAVREGQMTDFRHRFRDVDVLVIDDIHFLAKRDRTQEEFFHTFNSLYQARKQIVLSSDAPPDEIPDLEDRLVSRFKCGLVASIDPPCYETRVQILKNKARLREFEVPDSVVEYMASRNAANIRELEGFINTLQIHASMAKRTPDLDMAVEVLGEETPRSDRQLQVQTIISEVADFYGVKVTDLLSKKRPRSISMPRQVCMFLARQYTRYSLEEIGARIGGRDHTTVMHALRTVERRRVTDPQLNFEIRKLEENLSIRQ